MIEIIKPEWNAPKHIHAFVTTRTGGYSKAPFQSLNLAYHVEDLATDVKANRELLKMCLNLPQEPVWLKQIHGNKIVCADDFYKNPPEADGSFAKLANQICVILTADCLPVLLTNKKGSIVAALHCGWRGLAANLITHAVEILKNHDSEIIAWLGPAISAKVYEVGQDLRETFITLNSAYQQAFYPGKSKRWFMNLYEIARLQLLAAGVHEITGGHFCTFNDSKNFFSFRRDQGQTGRMATVIWIEDGIRNFKRIPHK